MSLCSLSVLGVSSDFWVLTVGIRNSTPQKHPERLRTQRQWGKSSLFLYFGPWSSVWNGVWHFGSEMGQIRSQQNTLPKFQGVHHPTPPPLFLRLPSPLPTITNLPRLIPSSYKAYQPQPPPPLTLGLLSPLPTITNSPSLIQSSYKACNAFHVKSK